MVQLMLANDADPHLFDSTESYVHSLSGLAPTIGNDASSLHMACATGHEKIVKDLLACGANLESSVGDSRTPLCATAAGGHLSVLQILLDAGANIDEDSNDSAL